MQAAQNMPLQPEHFPPEAFAAPQPSQHGGLFHFFARAGVATGDLGLLIADACTSPAACSPSAAVLACAEAVMSADMCSGRHIWSGSADAAGEGGRVTIGL